MRRREFLQSMAIFGVASAARLGAQNNPIDGSSLAHDPDRPEYHLLPPHNWMNDPNGPIYWQGRYHLFYQLNPNAAVWGDMHWGHASSADMIHWRHEPIALAPTPGGDDSAGCFSGSAVIYNNRPLFIYTGVKRVPAEQATILDAAHNLRESQLMAIALDDSLNHWKKLDHPLIPGPPKEIAATGFRDPCVWYEAGEWWMIVGSGMRGIGGCALLYRAKQNSNLTEWEYLHPLAVGVKNSKSWPTTAADTVDSGEMWECPDFFRYGKSHCLIYSTERKVQWHTGIYNDQRFTPQQGGLLDHGAYYAPKSVDLPTGRRILWGWIQETRPEAEFARAGWAGVMSLPRVLSINQNGRLLMEPAAEVNSLRENQEIVILQPAAPRLHLLSTLRREVAVIGLNPQQHFVLKLNQQGKTLWSLELDGQSGTAHCGDVSFKIPMNELPVLRLFLDGSVIECFFGQSEAFTSRVYGLAPGESDLEVAFTGLGIVQCEIWNLRAISADKLTSGFPAL